MRKRLDLDKLGIVPEEILWIRNIPQGIDRLFEAAEIFKKHNYSRFSISDLLLLTRGEHSQSDVARLLRSIYEQEIEHCKRDLHLDVNSIAVFRKDTDNYRGNLFAARKVWQKFQPSVDGNDNDWSRDVKIPIYLNGQEITFLGYVWADTEIKLVSSPLGNVEPRTLRIIGNDNDYLLFSEYLRPTISDLFNIDIIDSDGNVPTVHHDNISYKNGKKYQYDVYTIELKSKAVGTWICDDLHIEADKDKRTIPAFLKSEEEIKHFLEGIIASSTFNRPKRHFVLSKKGPIYNNSLKDLFSRQGISINIDAKNIIYVDIENTKKIISNYTIINPIHKQYIQSSF